MTNTKMMTTKQNEVQKEEVFHQSKLIWKDGMYFTSDVNGFEITLDADPEHGGTGKGSRPKQLMLAALAGCTGMDVVSLLNKMRVPFESFSIDVKAHLTDEHPKYYDKVHLIYRINTSPDHKDKVEKAISLSQEKYCGVSAMFKRFSEVSFEILFA